ncbi:MAG TPA: chromate transporter [bacterium]
MPEATRPEATSPATPAVQPLTTWNLVRYFLYLGSLGFGGPVALVGYMQRDLVEARRWFTVEDFKKSLALSQLAPGPLAAQLAICLGFIQSGVAGATWVAFAFIFPSFLMTVAIGWAYVEFGGLPYMQAAFYGVGATVIAIIVRSAYKLAKLSLGADKLLWAIFVVVAVVTGWAEDELAVVMIGSGLLAMLWKAPPAFLRRGGAPLAVASPLLLLQLLAYFAQAGAFVFGSGLAIVPFLYGGVVQEYHWLNNQQFIDAVAVAMLTPGPVVITVAFIGYLVGALPGAVAAGLGMFIPVYLFVVVPFRWFDRISSNPRVKAFVDGITAAAAGALAGGCYVLARRAVYDWPTVIIALVALGIVWRFKVPEPVLIVAGAAVGLAVFALR